MLYKNKQWFLNQYNLGKTKTDIAKFLDVDNSTIAYWERKHGITLTKGSCRKDYFNEEFFKDIDTEYKAYTLGFIMADGYIHSNERTVILTLHDKDNHILEEIKNLVCSNQKIKSKKDKNQKILSLSSVNMVKDLSKFGVIKNKTYSLPFPQYIEDSLIRHLLRGYFDGDGWLGDNQAVLVSASHTFILGLFNYIKAKFNVTPLLRENKRPTGTHWRLEFCTRDSTFIKWMYKDCNIKLTRKHNVYEKYWAFRKE